MKNARWFVAGLLAVGMGAAASAGILDDAIFHVDFGSDSVDDVNSGGGGLSTGVADPSITFTNTPTMDNSNGRGAVLNRTGGIDYGLGAGNELKIEGSMTYHVRVKFDALDGADQVLMGRFGTTSGGGERVNLLTTSATSKAWGFSSVDGIGNIGNPTGSNILATNRYYDIFFRYGSGELFQTAVYEVGDTNSVSWSSAWLTGIIAQYDSSDIMFWLGARGDYTSATSPLAGVIDQANVWTQMLFSAEMDSIVGTVNPNPPKPTVPKPNGPILSESASYEYSAAWPGTPSTWGDTTPPSKLTDGDEGNLVIENGNEPFVIFNFDLGSDVDIAQLRGLAIETPWNNNTLEFIDFFVRTEAEGPFTTGYATVAGEASWSMLGVAVDKTNPAGWVVDTGPITVTARYLTIWADNTTNLGKTGLTEVQAFGPEVAGIPAILSFVSIPSSNMVKMVVDAPSSASLYSPKASTDLTGGVWSSVTHSDDGVNAFVITNLGYSSLDVTGSNKVIYVQSSDALKFFKIIGE